VWNVPNWITLLRIAGALAMFAAVAAGWYVAALVLFVTLAATDWLDGFYARRYGQVTRVGRILDPFADKLLVLGLFIFLAAAPGSPIHAWMAVLVLARELWVTTVRGFMEGEGHDFSARWSGKVKMALQCAAGSAALLCLVADRHAQRTWYGAAGQPAWLFWLTAGVVGAAIVVTAYSAFAYTRAAVRALEGEPS